MELRRFIGERLERGAPGGPVSRAVAAIWSRSAAVERRLRFPEGKALVVVGGPTLGGSGKTPLAIACAGELARVGARVAVAGHAYRARPGSARRVTAMDSTASVGDEARVCAARLGVDVTVGPTRQAAVDLAFERADVVVVDGVCQTSPRRATLSLLAVDAEAPWGAGVSPPLGDLRAAPERLAGAVDRVVAVLVPGGAPRKGGRFTDAAWAVSRGARMAGRLLSWPELRAAKVGLVTAVARPDRVLRMLHAYGVRPVCFVPCSDHGALRIPRGGTHPWGASSPDVWLCTEKCAAGLPGLEERAGSAPVAVLDYSLRLDRSLAMAVRGVMDKIGVLTLDSGRAAP